MKYLAPLALVFFIGVLSFAPVTNAGYVNGYYRSNGTYVHGYYRSSADGNPYNNYSFPGNTNPYTGVTATGNPDTYLRTHDSGYAGNTYTIPTYTTSTYVPSTYTPSYTYTTYTSTDLTPTVSGVVVYEKSTCDYFIVSDGTGTYALLEWYGGRTPSKGDLVYGSFNGYGFKDIYTGVAKSKTHVWVEDYLLSVSNVITKYTDKCN